MEQLHTDPTDPERDSQSEEEPLSDYVKRMETEENLRRLADRLEQEWKKATPAAKPEVPDLSFEKFEEKRKGDGGQ
ncbi:hypothetical protein [Dyadobacter sp. 676]|uniref:Uncharacterized protein n=1 Tax=Dyadobacter sp. 676 TaxID=3088362 RepID=A0AAU8FP87_9BACT